MFTSESCSGFFLGRKFVAGMRILGVLSLLLLVGIAPLAADRPLIAVGDVHGNYEALVGLLTQAGLLNKKTDWSGKRTTLVFTGDLLDRGPDSRQVLDLLMKLEKQANRKGGHVIVLLGNHEIMNLTGDLRYVSGEEYASYADEKSNQRRAVAFQKYAKFLQRNARVTDLDSSSITPELEQAWMESHPEGFIEHREAFGPGGRYGKWLRRKAVLAQVNSHLFLHGGISLELSTMPVQQINERIWVELEAFDNIRDYLVEQELILPFFTLREMTEVAQKEVERLTQSDKAREGQSGTAPNPQEEERRETLKTFLSYRGWLSFHPSGPVWFRGYSNWSDAEGNAKVQEILANYQADRIVVGHTPQTDFRIHHRFGQRVYFIDTGMLSSHYSGGNPSLLKVEGGEWNALYLDGQREITALPTVPTEGPKLPAETASAGSVSTNMETARAPSVSARNIRVWLDPNGNRLPFESEEDLLNFLRTARVVRRQGIGEGITNPKKLLLEQDGVQMHAIFRYVNDNRRGATRLGDGRTVVGFRDSYLFEVAAYELGKLLGMDAIPPAVLRSVNGQEGSVQVWIEGAMMEKDRLTQKIQPPNPVRWRQQKGTLRLFDELVQNTDRHVGNLLIDRNWKIWFIDHTRAFRIFGKLKNLNRIFACERTLWENLQALDKVTLRDRLGKYLRRPEIDAILKRRDAIVAHLRARIESDGEENIIYSREERETQGASSENQR